MPEPASKQCRRMRCKQNGASHEAPAEAVIQVRVHYT